MTEPDWPAIERDYRETPNPVRRLARRHNVPEATLRARAKREGWERGRKPLSRLEIVRNAGAAGMDPLDYMLAIMRDENEDLDVRCDMAIAAAPYCHRKAGR